MCNLLGFRPLNDILKVVIQEVERVLNAVVHKLPAFTFGQVEANAVSPFQHTWTTWSRVVHRPERGRQMDVNQKRHEVAERKTARAESSHGPSRRLRLYTIELPPRDRSNRRPKMETAVP